MLKVWCDDCLVRLSCAVNVGRIRDIEALLQNDYGELPELFI